MPIFTPERLAQIPADPTDGLVYICDFFFEVDTENKNTGGGDIKDYIEFYALLKTFCGVMGFNHVFEDIPLHSPHVKAFIRNVFSEIQSEAKKASQEKTSQSYEQFFSNHFRGIQQYELSDGDISEIQRLTNELRDRITQTLDLEEKHKHRILKRLESLQKEIHKTQSNFDILTGTMCEVLAVIKKSGEAAEPWVRIVKSILQIVWASQGRVYELPSSMPMSLLGE